MTEVETMTEIDPELVQEFKDLPFVKSWQNTYISKAQKILKKATKKELKARKKALLENDSQYMALKEACK